MRVYIALYWVFFSVVRQPPGHKGQPPRGFPFWKRREKKNNKPTATIFKMGFVFK
jgi:hypothetical protein